MSKGNLTGLEKAFVKSWSECDEIFSDIIQFYDCEWTDYTKALLPNHEEFEIFVLCTGQSKVEFYHKESSSKNVVMEVKLGVV
ncbi:hypothetical protein NVP1170O_196 [Vibrio phage 1.170.O._10N.261.52.C3]|nr:hypothetical protein NVP1170O_196 [Vibrio phage 1.170.O._10N.261.52.C3]